MKRVINIILLILLSSPVFSQNVYIECDSLTKLVNEVRVENSLVPVSYSDKLESVAKIQAEYLSTLNNIYDITHIHPIDSLRSVWDRISTVTDDKFFSSSENITVFTVNDLPNVNEISVRAFKNFIESEPHKRSILTNTEDYFSKEQEPFSYGQSILYSPNKKWVIVVQVFASNFED